MTSSVVERTIRDILRDGLFVDGDWVESKDQDPEGSVRLTQLADVGETTWRDRSDRWMNDGQARRLGITYLEPNDVLVARMPDPVGRACLVPEDIGSAATVVDVAILRPSPRTVESRYLMYGINSMPARNQIELLQAGATRLRVSRKNLGAIKIPFWPLSEQRAIADYLDRETAQIDTLVAKQEELVGLLSERRKGAVLALLPQPGGGSSVDKLRRRVQMGNGSTPRSGEDRYWVGGGIPWMNSSVVNAPEAWEPSRLVTEAALNDCHLPLVRRGAILVALTGQGKTRGKASILRVDSTINQHLAYLAPDEGYWVSEYLQWLLYSKYDYLRMISGENGATRGGLTLGDLGSLPVIMPSLDEQHRIVNELGAVTSRIDTLIAKAEQHIALAKERRSALITAAVTGQIDVRTARKAS